MSRYYYSQVTGGYRWNMLQRISEVVGVVPTSSSDVAVGEGMQTVIECATDLTALLKAQLDTLMASNPTQPPLAIGTVFKIKDIWENRDGLKASVGGLTFRIYFSESVLGSIIV